MSSRVYVIYDIVAKEAGPLFTAKNDDVAARNFRQLLAHENVEDPKEYQLMCVGEYDSEQPSLFGLKVNDIINVEEDDE